MLLFVCLFSLLPGLVAVLASTRIARPYVLLAETVVRTSPRFAVATLAQALLAACVWGAALGVLSLWAWGPGESAPLGRALRLVAAPWIAALLFYPTFGNYLAIVRDGPWLIGGIGLASVWAASGLHRALRFRPRELVVTAGAVLLFCHTFRLGPPDVPRLAGRGFTSSDVLLLGFDSITETDAAAALERFTPSRGTKVIFTHAMTSVPLTGGAWRTVLSGQMPDGADLIPGASWPVDLRAWLPAQLESRGYRPVMLQDDPMTNVYRPHESLRLGEDQGWRSAFREFAWETLFPLSSTGGRWWVSALGGPGMNSGQFAYCPACFMDSVLARLGRDARDGPVFVAAHTCYAHWPTRLSLSEATSVPGWWKRTPRQLSGATNPSEVLGSDDIGVVRRQSVVRLVMETLAELDRSGVLGRATVIVLSDHGPRGRTVGAELTQHVMLAAFLPGARHDRSVDEPVSLADIAPTLRARLGLESPAVAGLPLPLADEEHLPTHRPVSVAPRDSPVEDLDLWHGDPSVVRGLMTLEPDGSFRIDESRLRRLIATGPPPGMPAPSGHRRTDGPN